MPAGRPVPTDAGNAYHHGNLKRSLLDAALALLAETQDWSFSLREVARRAGVSHNAPYNHFADKRDLLVALAAAGYEALCARTLAVAADLAAGEVGNAPDQALVAIGVAYVRFGTDNPALYRLMFGPTLAAAEGPSAMVAEAAAKARAVLGEVVLRGAREGVFAASPDDRAALELATLSAWSIVHGLTLLLIDGLAGSDAGAFVAEAVGCLLVDGIARRG